MAAFSNNPDTPVGKWGGIEPQPGSVRSSNDRVLSATYTLLLAASISIWFLAIRAPLWLDETVSFSIIKSGLSEIMSRQGWPAVPAYPYILWLWTKIAGTSEIALRIPSVLAMLGAAYLLYRAARELFDRDFATIATIMFCIHPLVIFASIDARPYAFGVLTINAAILAVFRLRRSNSYWLAALFGFLAACIVYFHFLFVVILPALAICFFAIKTGNRKIQWQQFGVALAVFALAFVPVIPGLRFMFHTSGSHVFDEAPQLVDLIATLAPGWTLMVLAGSAFVAALAAAGMRRHIWNSNFDGRRFLLCASLALIPILILYEVSKKTSIHVFVPRYRLVAVPGIALCWALAINWFESRAIKLLFCVAIVAMTAQQYYSNPIYRHHNESWKGALEVVQMNASRDHSPVLICSDLPESDYVAMQTIEVGDSTYFPSLTYYKVSTQVVPLPRSLNQEAMRVGSQFLQDATAKHQRFLAIASVPSYKTLDWIALQSSGAYTVHKIGVFGRIEVLEFIPLSEAAISR